MEKNKKYFITSGTLLKDAIEKMNENVPNNILFVIDKEEKLIGSLSDGDIRRGLLKGVTVKSEVNKIINKSPRYITKENFEINKIIKFREENLKIIPVLSKQDEIIRVINFNEQKSYLPLDIVIMAGGKGLRLHPLTDKMPKPLLEIDGKPIMEYVLDHLISFGIENFWVSINYLGDQIISYFGDGKNKNVTINYIKESSPLGTIGAVSKINSFKHNYILIINSDLICNVNYEDFLQVFLNENADLAVLTTPYSVSIPYAIIETEGNKIKTFKEKPTYSYQSNGGVYLVKKKVLNLIPKETFFNATDLIEKAVEENLKVISYSFSGYWLDIGKHEDFEKAKTEIKQVKF